MRHLHIVTESSSRKQGKIPAKQFYQSSKSRWVNHILLYLEEIQVNWNDVYFVSFYHHRVIPSETPITYYPKRTTAPTAKDKKLLAEQVMKKIASYREKVKVHLHAGKDVTGKLVKKLKERKIPFVLYAEGVALGQKPEYYQKRIEEARTQKLLSKWKEGNLELLSVMEYYTVHEAKTLLETKKMESREEYSLLRQLVKKHRERTNEFEKAKKEWKKIERHVNHDLKQFLVGKTSIAQLVKHPKPYQKMKRQYGKELSLWIRMQIKLQYLTRIENKIHETLHMLQIQLLKEL